MALTLHVVEADDVFSMIFLGLDGQNTTAQPRTAVSVVLTICLQIAPFSSH
jgi:hypothetical protein